MIMTVIVYESSFLEGQDHVALVAGLMIPGAATVHREAVAEAVILVAVELIIVLWSLVCHRQVR